jgi:hypothetical protein
LFAAKNFKSHIWPLEVPHFRAQAQHIRLRHSQNKMMRCPSAFACFLHTLVGEVVAHYTASSTSAAHAMLRLLGHMLVTLAHFSIQTPLFSVEEQRVLGDTFDKV